MGAVILLLELRWRKGAERLQQALRGEPRHPFECGVLDVLQAYSWPAATNHFGRVQPDHALRERVEGTYAATVRRPQ